MEKFYIIQEGSRLHTDYWRWKDSISVNNRIVNDFFKRYRIEATQYWISNNQIGIMPTENDENKFENQFTKYASENGLYLFKRNSVVGKDWIRQAENMKIYHKPFPSWYNSYLTGRSSSRLFDHKGILYCSISAEKINVENNGFQEIKGSEFYKILEEIMEENNV